MRPTHILKIQATCLRAVPSGSKKPSSQTRPTSTSRPTSSPGRLSGRFNAKPPTVAEKRLKHVQDLLGLSRTKARELLLSLGDVTFCVAVVRVFWVDVVSWRDEKQRPDV